MENRALIIEIEIPFMAEFEPLMLTGKKSTTSRRKRYGYPDDYFKAFGRYFSLISVEKMRLFDVAEKHYLEEGFNSPFEFQRCWKKLHPRKGYDPDQIVWFHRFKFQVDTIPPFHVHELEASGYCRICGIDPTPIQIKTREIK